jgi:enoyl-CoA hydratase
MSQTQPSSPTLTIEGSRATIALQRPTKRNRIEPPDITAIIGHCDTIEAEGEVRVVVVRSEGPSWCSGYHLGALADGERSEHSFGDLCDRIETVSVPTIAALHGNVHGGGTDLAVSCDFRIGADSIVLAMPAARIGLQYYASGLRRFVERIGPDATKRLFLTAETLTATDLLRLGYCTELVEADALSARVDELASTIATLAPDAVRQTKAAINQLSAENTDLEAIEAAHIKSARSDDHKEAMVALKEKRPPRFG